MALTIKDYDMAIAKNENGAVTLNFTKDIYPSEGDTAVFMVKKSSNDADVDAIISTEIDILQDRKVPIVILAADTVAAIPNTYRWSLKINTVEFGPVVAIPVDANDGYPKFEIKEDIMDIILIGSDVINH